MALDRQTVLTIKDAHFKYRTNFGGSPDKYNKAGGKRYFNVIVPEDIVDKLIDDGWHVKETHPQDDQAVEHYIKVIVNFNNFNPPKIWVKTPGGEPIRIYEDLAHELDSYHYLKIDQISIVPWITDKYNFDYPPAYLKSMYATIEDEDDSPADFFGAHPSDDDEEIPFE